MTKQEQDKARDAHKNVLNERVLRSLGSCGNGLKIFHYFAGPEKDVSITTADFLKRMAETINDTDASKKRGNSDNLGSVNVALRFLLQTNFLTVEIIHEHYIKNRTIGELTLNEVFYTAATGIDVFTADELFGMVKKSVEGDDVSHINEVTVNNRQFDKVIALLCKNRYEIFDRLVGNVLLPQALNMDDCAEAERRFEKIMRAIDAQETTKVSVSKCFKNMIHTPTEVENCLKLFTNKKLMRKIAPGNQFFDLLDEWIVSIRCDCDDVAKNQHVEAWLALRHSSNSDKQKTVEKLLLNMEKHGFAHVPSYPCMAINLLMPERISIGNDLGKKFAKYAIGNHNKELSLFWSRVQIDGFDQALANSLYEKALRKADGFFVNDIISRCEDADLAKPRVEDRKEFLHFFKYRCRPTDFSYTYVDPAVGLDMLNIMGRRMSALNGRSIGTNELELIRQLTVAVEQSYAADGLDIDIRAARRAITVKMMYTVTNGNSVLENPLYVFMRKIDPNTRPLNSQCVSQLVQRETNRDVVKQLLNEVGIASSAKINGDSFDIDGTNVRYYAIKILAAFEVWDYCVTNDRYEDANTFRRLFMCVIRNGGTLLAKKIMASHPDMMCAWLKEEESVLSYLLSTRRRDTDTEELLLDFAKKQQIRVEIPQTLLSITHIADYDRYADIFVKTPVGVAFVCYSILRNGKQKTAQKLWRREKFTLSSDDMKAVFGFAVGSRDGLKILFDMEQCFDVTLPPEECLEKVVFSEREWDITKSSMDLMVNARTQFDWRKISFPRYLPYHKLDNLGKHSPQFFSIMIESMVEGTKDDNEALRNRSIAMIQRLFWEAIDDKLEWLLKLLLSKGAVPDADVIIKSREFIADNNAEAMILGSNFSTVLQREMEKAGYSLDGQTQNAEKSA